MTPRFERATLIVNPAARGVSKRFEASEVLADLRARGLDVRLETPGSADDTRRVAAEAAERGDGIVFAVGGDGTLRLAAEGVAGSETALAAVPGGTVNIWAREAGIPPGIRAALQAHLGGQDVPVDLGRADGHGFILMAGLGWDALVAGRVGMRLKSWLGDKAYMIQAAMMTPGLRPIRARWRVDGAEQEGELALMVLSNTRLYGGRVEFAPRATANDGQLDVCALCPSGPVDALRLSAKLLRHQLEGDAHAITGRATEVEVETPGVPYQLDGDVVGETPARFTVQRAVVRMSIPAGPLPPVLGGPEPPTRPRNG
jgi:diacylglycerol kinase (ATP)